MHFEASGNINAPASTIWSIITDASAYPDFDPVNIRIEGTMNKMPCMLLAHQSTVQMLCYVEKLPKGEGPRKIGFIIEGEATEV